MEDNFLSFCSDFPMSNTFFHTYVSPWRKMCVLRLVGVARAEHMESPAMGVSGEGPPQSWVVLVTAWVGSGEGEQVI